MVKHAINSDLHRTLVRYNLFQFNLKKIDHLEKFQLGADDLNNYIVIAGFTASLNSWTLCYNNAYE